MLPKRGKIIDTMAERDVYGVQGLAKKAGVSLPTARKVLAGESVSVKVAASVSKALGLAPTDLFDLEGI